VPDFVNPVTEILSESEHPYHLCTGFRFNAYASLIVIARFRRVQDRLPAFLAAYRLATDNTFRSLSLLLAVFGIGLVDALGLDLAGPFFPRLGLVVVSALLASSPAGWSPSPSLS
jgi:hypothetical protein